MKKIFSTRWIGSWMSLILVATLLIPGKIYADELQEKKEDIKKRDKEIQRLEKERAATKKELKAAFADLDRKKRELADRSKEVYDLEQKLQKTKGNLDKKEEQLKDQEHQYKNRLRTVYQQGEMFYFESLMNAENLSQFLNRLKFVRVVAERDQELVEKYRRDRAALRQEKKKYEDLLADRREKEKAARALHAKLIGEYKKYEKDLNKLAKDQEHLEEVNEQEKEKIRDLVRKQQEAQQAEEKRTGEKASYDGGGGAFLKPVKGPITSRYGMRYHPVRKQYRMHTGVDFGASLGTPIRAAAGGMVIDSRPAKGYGYIVVIDHGGGIATLYAHMYAQDVKVSSGQKVSKGQVIAGVGNNGWSTGPHLHFEVLKNGQHTDPMPYLK